MKKVLIIVVALTLSAPLFAKPSWCKNAHTYVEKKICKSRKLIDLDYEENAIYTRMRDYLKANNKELYKALLKDEDDWVRYRDTECYNRSNSCIESIYKERIKELYSIVREN